MTEKVFVDSNILIYARDLDEGRKREVAAARLAELWQDKRGVISTQVLQEFYVTATRKLRLPMSRREARAVVSSYASWPVETITVPHLVHASEIEERHRISFWDGLIVAAAVRAGATRILTEDLNHGQRLEGVVVENPFAS